MKPGDSHQIKNGQLLDGRYRVVEKLGAGAHSSVYKVLDNAMAEEVVCIKLLHDHLASCERNQERFQGEVRILENIMHHNVVRTFDCGTTEGNIPYIVMEHVQGGDLAKHLEDVGRFSVDATKRILHSLLQALALVHEHGVIHRDIKPSNVLLDDDGVAKLIDFGVAKVTENDFELTRSGDSVGSPRYMSPEQLCNKEVTAASDLYALGLLVFELLSGEAFHTGASPYSVSVQQNSEYLRTRLGSLPDEVPENLITFIERCCQVDPKARYASAFEALTELYEVAARPKKRRRTSVVFGKRKVWTIIGALVFTAALITFAFFVRFHNDVQIWFVGRVLFAEEFTEKYLGFTLESIKRPLQYENLKLTPEVFERILRRDRTVAHKKWDEAFTLFMLHAFGENNRIKPSYRLSDGKSLIFYLVDNGEGRHVDALIERGVPICEKERFYDVPIGDCRTSDGMLSGELTTLQMAAKNNNSAFLTLFSEGLQKQKCGIDWINYRNSHCGISALGFLIINSGNESSLKKALKIAADYELDTEIGRGERRSTLLHHAVHAGNLFALEPLLKHFPELVDAQDARGDVPLHYADMTGNRLFFERLMQAGADPRIQNNEGVDTTGFAALLIIDNLWSDHFSELLRWENIK